MSDASAVHTTSRHASPAYVEIWQYRDLLRHLVNRELKAKYKRSVLGRLWSLLNPLLMAFVYTMVFAVFLKQDPPVGVPSGLRSFGVFLLCGLIPWNFFGNLMTQGSTAIVAGADLVRKVYFPRAILVLGQAASLLVSFLLELVVLFVIILVAGGGPHLSLVMLPVLIVLQLLFVSGLGMLVAAVNVFFRDLQHLLGILLTIWFFATPIVYPPSRIPVTVDILGRAFPIRAVMQLNPMVSFVRAYRDVLYNGRIPGPRTMAFIVIVSLLSFSGCYAIFRRLERRFAEEV